eukprot:12427934-Karenia_brevis.AAC.1
MPQAERSQAERPQAERPKDRMSGGPTCRKAQRPKGRRAGGHRRAQGPPQRYIHQCNHEGE